MIAARAKGRQFLTVAPKPGIDPVAVGEACSDGAYPSEAIMKALGDPKTAGQAAKRLADVCGQLMDELRTWRAMSGDKEV